MEKITIVIAWIQLEVACLCIQYLKSVFGC